MSEGAFEISLACLSNSIYTGKHVSAFSIVVTEIINKKQTTYIIENTFNFWNADYSKVHSLSQGCRDVNNLTLTSCHSWYAACNHFSEANAYIGMKYIR